MPNIGGLLGSEWCKFALDLQAWTDLLCSNYRLHSLCQIFWKKLQENEVIFKNTYCIACKSRLGPSVFAETGARKKVKLKDFEYLRAKQEKMHKAHVHVRNKNAAETRRNATNTGSSAWTSLTGCDTVFVLVKTAHYRVHGCAKQSGGMMNHPLHPIRRRFPAGDHPNCRVLGFLQPASTCLFRFDHHKVCLGFLWGRSVVHEHWVPWSRILAGCTQLNPAHWLTLIVAFLALPSVWV